MNLELYTQELRVKAVNTSAKTPWQAPKYIVMLHGQGDRKEAYEALHKEINLAGLSSFLIDAPYKLPGDEGLYGHFWYSMDPSNKAQTDRDVLQSTELLEKFLDQLKAQGINDEDLFLFGFSAGGRIVLNTLFKRKRSYGGVVLLSPRMVLLDELRLNQEIPSCPLFISRGHSDGVIPVETTREGIRSYLEGVAEGQLSYTEFDIDHEICIEQVQLLREWLADKM